jgi:hypothetical protein
MTRPASATRRPRGPAIGGTHHERASRLGLSAAPRPTGTVPPQEAVLFGMDGVVMDTAGFHAAGWKRLFDEVLDDPRLAS